MSRRWTVGVGLSLLLSAEMVTVYAEGQTSQANSQTDASSVSSTVTAVDVDDIRPSITVTDGNGKAVNVSVDRSSTKVTLQNAGGQLSDLKVGQHIQVTGTYKAIIDRVVAKTISIVQEPTAAASASTTSSTASTQRNSTSAASTAAKPTPSVLKSIPESEER